MFASTQFFCAWPLLPPVPSVVRDSEPSPANGMFEVAETAVVPAVADVITTVQLALALPPRRSPDLAPTKLPGPLEMVAVAVPPPAAIMPPDVFTVIVSV